jgi:predicted ABC-type ATPase
MPSLTILAGPNGAGKSRNTDFLLAENLLPSFPVDLDLLVAQALNDLPYSFYGADIRLAKSVDKLFYSYCMKAIKAGLDFCYECNFRKDQLKYVGLFEEANYSLNLVFFLLNNTEQSAQRVSFRVNQQNGRNVDFESIQENFKQGLSNLDNHFQDFHRVLIIDGSQDDYTNIGHTLNVQLEIEGSKVTCFNKDFPSKEHRLFLPKISALVERSVQVQKTTSILNQMDIKKNKDKGLSM